ncbi:protein trichome birefringence-like 18 [Trifolium pratense]|uniref:Protein trichome birefringence-like 18 n=1 Tax=Trifolium pratense TaxID=57577 RepID=A0A2K3L7X8_TRIPR|nr:protein trichome birefringence-like 18 [Trifolium pratense]
MQRYYFRSASVMIVRIWSSWLVKQTSEPFDYAPAGVDKLHLDAPDTKLMEYIPNFDVVVLSSGHWFAKQSVYILNNEIVGGQLWWPDKSKQMKVNNIQAYGISVETILTALAAHPTYKGLTIVRSYSPDHYEGGAWNTGGSCTGKVKPITLGKLVENEYTNTMHGQQVTGFNRAMEKATNQSKLKLMDITKVFQYRHDGHPGPYRSPDPNKITKRGPDGRPPPQDCLHWCMPGPVDTWNELVLEIIKREYEGGIFNWIKCNTDGASIGVPALAACGGIFRNSSSDHLGSFAFNIGDRNAFLAELTGAMLAIEIAASKNWVNLWLESESRLVFAFSKSSMVPWRIRNRWMNALLLTKSMRFMATDIYREENHCVDKLANIGLTVQTFTWWDDVHRALSMDFARNKIGLPCFRFVNF